MKPACPLSRQHVPFHDITISQSTTPQHIGVVYHYNRLHSGSRSTQSSLCLTCNQFLADRTNGRAIGTVLRLSSMTLCIVAKRCVLEQKLLLRAYRKSYMRNRLVPK